MILYNGSTGSLGQYLAPTLFQEGVQGTALRSRLEDREGLRNELGGIGTVGLPGTPVTLVQMAAKVPVIECERDPEGAYRTNVEGTLATVEEFVRWAEAQRLRPFVLYVSTGHVYRPHPWGTKIREDAPLVPRSVYAKTKALAEERLQSLCPRLGVALLIARVFGLVGPKQTSDYVLPGLIQRVRRRDLKAIPGLNYVRDYLDARDVCRGLIRLCCQRATSSSFPLVVNVCSGEGTPIRAMVEQIAQVLFPECTARLLAELGEAPGRRDDIPWIVGDPSLLLNLLHKPVHQIPLAQTIHDALDQLSPSRDWKNM